MGLACIPRDILLGPYIRSMFNYDVAQISSICDPFIFCPGTVGPFFSHPACWCNRINYNNSSYFFNANRSEETIKRTTVKYWDNNSKINLEKSLKVGEEISGHFVYGHVDTTLKLSKIEKLTSSWNYYFSTSSSSNYNKFIAEKGSIAINGVSLTIANVKEEVFDISIIPHTYNNTNFSNLKVGNSVNIEFDSLAKYIHSKND